MAPGGSGCALGLFCGAMLPNMVVSRTPRPGRSRLRRQEAVRTARIGAVRDAEKFADAAGRLAAHTPAGRLDDHVTRGLRKG